MQTRIKIIAIMLVIVMTSAACNLPTADQSNANEAASLTLTAIAQTTEANLPTATPTFTEIPATATDTATSAPPTPTTILDTPTPSGTFFIVDVGANCRTGPGTVYDKTTSFAAGTYLTLVGHNTDNTWWYVLVGNLNCWISGSTGHTTGQLNNLPLITAPPTPTVPVTAGPKLTSPIALVAEVSYPSNCTSNTLQVAIHASDNGHGINSVWLQYRYVGDGGYTGAWHSVPANDNAAGGVYGFNYAIGTEAAGELTNQNGTLQYQFYAKDNSGNTSSYPDGSVLGMPIKYCP